MRILLTNDDGINAEGLRVLERIARQISDDIWVVAPETDQSGVAHSLTLSEPLRLRQIDERHFALRGTPTDCVIFACRHILPQKPDLILSGVNAGGNLGDDVTYSGTVAGAIEGTLIGIRSIALSQEYGITGDKKIMYWDTVEAHAPELLKKLINTSLPQGCLLNLNFPACETDMVKEVKVTSQGSISHEVSIDERFDGRGFPYYWLRFKRDLSKENLQTDVGAVHAKHISLTPLQLNLTAHDMLDALSKVVGGK